MSGRVQLFSERTMNKHKTPPATVADGVLFKACYETAMMSTTKINVSLGPIGPEPFGP
jgi:hypothetical protein